MRDRFVERKDVIQLSRRPNGVEAEETEREIIREITLKVTLNRLPFVSLTTPTASTVDLARKYNLTLIGYARDGRAVLYSGRERILY